VPDRLVRAMAQPIIDHRGPKFAATVEMMPKELGVPVRLGAGLAAAEEVLTGS
jgi:hypothetical protein